MRGRIIEIGIGVIGILITILIYQEQKEDKIIEKQIIEYRIESQEVLNSQIKKILKIVKENQKASTEEEKNIEKILEDILKSQDLEVQKVAKLLKDGKLKEATEILEKLHEKQENLSSKYNKGLAKTKLQLVALNSWKNPYKALKLLKEAYKLDETNIQIVNQLGLLTMRLGKSKEAINVFEKLKSLSKDNKQVLAVALGNLGLCYSSLENKGKARKYFNQSLEILQAIGSPNAKIIKEYLDNLKY